MEFVIHVLMRFFEKTRTEATRVMLNVHHKGVGVAGAYSHEIAETKISQVDDYSKSHEYPLKLTMEPEG
jgi:ATP-dependent Clp protease adaptor protein ClpS